MSKFLFLILVGLLLYVVFTRVRRPQDKPPRAPAPEAMVQCARCGVHVPLGESLAAGDKRYCCEEHRRLGHH